MLHFALIVMKIFRVPAILFLLLSPFARAEEPGNTELIPQRVIPQSVQGNDATPLILGWMIQPLSRGMRIRLPVIDTDPNRGITIGIMPIWVLQAADDGIRHIHAPSLTYNKDFSVTPTYRYYFYPHEDAALIARGSVGKYENELLGQYEDGSFFDSALDIFLRVQHNVDASQRFYGFGPNSSKLAEANYRESLFQYNAAAGHPLRPDSKWRARFSNHFQASKFTNGPIPALRGFADLYPSQASSGRQQTNEWRANLIYDSRDHGITTARGQYLDLSAQTSIRGLASMYDYNRWGAESRIFLPWKSDPGKVFAIQCKFEQVTGTTPPFWLQSRLGGKYSLRAYGDGRYIDRGMAFVNVEQRFSLHEAKMTGVATEFQLAPFAGVGTVFDSPEKLHRRFIRPVFGASLRAVAKPQVVGSLDFGLGQEGLAVFMDINYSF